MLLFAYLQIILLLLRQLPVFRLYILKTNTDYFNQFAFASFLQLCVFFSYKLGYKDLQSIKNNLLVAGGKGNSLDQQAYYKCASCVKRQQ